MLYHQCEASIAVSRVLARSNSNTAQLSDDSMTHRVIVTLKSQDGMLICMINIVIRGAEKSTLSNRQGRQEQGPKRSENIGL